VPAGCGSVWAQYTIRVPAARRDRIAADLKAQGIPTAIHYAKPLHRQTAFGGISIAADELPVSERLAGEVLSLPMHPYLAEDAQDRITDAVCRATIRK
jgi:dTDP-4-amino-4,6-dideoxygalactose transaminase